MQNQRGSRTKCEEKQMSWSFKKLQRTTDDDMNWEFNQCLQKRD